MRDIFWKVIPEKDMFGLLVHEPVSENTAEGDEQKGQENGRLRGSNRGESRGNQVSTSLHRLAKRALEFHRWRMFRRRFLTSRL